MVIKINQAKILKLLQLQQFRDAARRPFAGLESKEKERESPQSSGQSSSNISTGLLKPANNSTPDSKARRSKLCFIQTESICVLQVTRKNSTNVQNATIQPHGKVQSRPT